MTPDVHLKHLDAGGGAPAAVVLLGLEELQPGAGAGLAGVILVPTPGVAQEAVTAAPGHMSHSTVELQTNLRKHFTIMALTWQGPSAG